MTEKAKLVYEDENFGQKVTLEFSSGADIYEFMQEVQKLALAIGYHPNTVEDGFLAITEEIESTREKDAENE